MPNSAILSAYVATDDIVGRPSENFLIDFPSGLGEAEASAFELPFEHLRAAKYDPHREVSLLTMLTIGQILTAKTLRGGSRIGLGLHSAIDL